MTMVAETIEEATVPKTKRSYTKRVKVQSTQSVLPKRVHLRELLAQDQPIWVINNTAEFARARKIKPGTITLQVGEGEMRDKVLIPPGSDPVCLSDQVDIESLRKCRDLFKAIDHKALILLDPEKAEDYYRQNEGRLSIIQQKIADAREMKKEDVLEPEKATHSDIDIDVNVIDICLTLKHPAENRTEAERINLAMERLRERAGTYTEEDLNYLLNNGKFAPIKNWAKQELKKLSPSE